MSISSITSLGYERSFDGSTKMDFLEEKRISDTEKTTLGREKQHLRKRKSKKNGIETHPSGKPSNNGTTLKQRKPNNKADSEWRVQRTWLVLLSLPIAFLVLYDIFGVGIQEHKTKFLIWWDLVGTVSYYRSRSRIYDIRDMKNTPLTFLWIGYVAFITYALYCGSGIIVKSLLNQEPQIPSLSSVVEFLIEGFFPAHYFPYDYLFTLTGDTSNSYTRRHVLIVSFAWAISKIKGFRRLVMEIVYLYEYDLASALLMSILSCEIGTIISKIEMNYFHHYDKMFARFPGGVWGLVTSASFKASIFGSAFMIISVKSQGIFLVDLTFNYLAFYAIFYKYSNGLLEKVFEENISSNKQLHEKVQKLFSLKTTANDWYEELGVAAETIQEFWRDLSFSAGYTAQTIVDDSFKYIREKRLEFNGYHLQRLMKQHVE